MDPRHKLYIDFRAEGYRAKGKGAVGEMELTGRHAHAFNARRLTLCLNCVYTERVYVSMADQACSIDAPLFHRRS